MNQSFVVPVPTGPGNSGAKRPTLRGQIYGKIPSKSPSTPGLIFVFWNSLPSVAKINLHLFHGKRSGLLDTAKFKGKASLKV